VFNRTVVLVFSVLTGLTSVVGFLFPNLDAQTRLVLICTGVGGMLVIGVFVTGYKIGRRKTIDTLGQIEEEMHRAGVIRVTRKRDTVEDLFKRIQNASSDIFFLGFSLTIQQQQGYAELLEEKARGNVCVRLLVPDPCKEEIILAVEKTYGRYGIYPRELENFFDVFSKIHKRVPENFLVRVHELSPCFSAAVYDNTSGLIDFPIYDHEGFKDDDRLVVELDLKGSAQDIKKRLDGLWNGATAINTEQEFRERIEATEKILQKRIDNRTHST